MSLKRKVLLLPILPVLVIELVVLKRSVNNYYSGQLSSPSKLISLEIQGFQTNQAVLGARTGLLSNLTIEKMLVGVVIFLVILIGILIFRGGNKQLEGGKSF